MEIVAVNGQVRNELGKKATRAFRREGLIPCVLYGGKENVHFAVRFNEIKNLIYTPAFKVAELNLEGKAHRAILKSYQMHPLTDEVEHIDFLALVEGQPIKLEVPLRLTGTSKGVKAGGKLLQKLRRIKIKTVPEKMVTEITLDTSHLNMGQSARVRDIKATDGVEILNSPGVPLATVEVPRAMRSAASAAAKAGEPMPEEEEAAE